MTHRFSWAFGPVSSCNPTRLARRPTKMSLSCCQQARHSFRSFPERCLMGPLPGHFRPTPAPLPAISVLPIIRRRPILRANTLPGGLICACSHSFKRRVQRSSQFPRPAAETAAINIHARIFVLLSKRSNGILLLIAKRRKREGQGRRATWDTGSDGAEDP